MVQAPMLTDYAIHEGRTKWTDCRTFSRYMYSSQKASREVLRYPVGIAAQYMQILLKQRSTVPCQSHVPADFPFRPSINCTEVHLTRRNKNVFHLDSYPGFGVGSRPSHEARLPLGAATCPDGGRVPLSQECGHL